MAGTKLRLAIQMKEEIQLLVDALLAWFSINARDIPWRRTRDPYAIHVSEIMFHSMVDRLGTKTLCNNFL